MGLSRPVFAIVWPQVCITEREVEDRGSDSGPLAWASRIVLSVSYTTCSGDSHFSFCVIPESAVRFQMILFLWPVHIGPEGNHLGQARLDRVLKLPACDSVRGVTFVSG